MMADIHPVATWMICLTASFVLELIIYGIALAVFRWKKGVSRKASNLDLAKSVNDIQIISNILQTLIPNEKELSLPGFLQFEPGTDFIMKKALTKGGAATILLGEIVNEAMLKNTGGVKVCVIKKITNGDDPKNEDLRAAFMQEVSLMWFFKSHPNFAKLIGFCSSPLLLVMKYYDIGSLGVFLHKKIRDDPTIWSSEMVLHFAHDIASGLFALHSSGIIHSDIKPENILVDKDESGKYFLVLTDLGISWIANTKSINVVKSFRLIKVMGASAPFAAPEVFKRIRHSSISDKEDVEVLKAGDTYAFSLTLWELVARKKAWRSIKSWEEVEMRVVSGERPQFPESIEEEVKGDHMLGGLIRIIAATWCQDPKARLTMEKVLDELERLERPDSTWSLASRATGQNSAASATRSTIAAV